MKLPISWIKEFVNINCDSKEFSDAMTLSGTKVEGVENKGAEIKNVVVSKVLKIEPHPDADKLVVVQTSIGEGEPIQIVTGAKNLFEGAIVPTALHGATLPNGIKIKKSKLRGVESNGMFCSIEELGFTKNEFPDAPENGIYIFNENHKLGTCVKEILQIDDDIIEFEITSNRSDCFSLNGIARETAATFKKELKLPSVSLKSELTENLENIVNVKIQDDKICKRYTFRIIKDIKIEPSPYWLRRRLILCGIRPINNIVDITNYVMLEMGQPMHAYDLNKINSKSLTVRLSEKGEKLTTLDGVEREFNDKTLIIEDADKLIDLAGIMGGENSMITDETKEILLESANFDGSYIRLASKNLGLRTDASSKYEKGLDPNLCMLALDRACQLIEEIGCGKVIKNTGDIYPNPITPWKVKYSYENINKLLGTNISSQEMAEILNLIEVKSHGEEATIPTFRQDLKTEVDLAEEIARFYGYDKIEETLFTGTPSVGKKNYKQAITNYIEDILLSVGLNETLSYSFEGTKVFDKLNIPQNSNLRETVTISNPLGEDFKIMRTTTLNSILNSLSINYSRRNKEALLFEIGKVYIPKELSLKELPFEKEIITIGMYGQVDFFELKSIFETLANKLGIYKLEYNSCESIEYMHQGRCAAVSFNQEEIGYLGEVHPSVLKNYNIGTRAYVGILELEKLVEFSNLTRNYKPLHKFPEIARDISIILKDEISVKEIENIIIKNAGSYLESVELFDIYKGNQVKDGHKSVAYNILFRAKDKTLKEEEINPYVEKIIKGLEKELNAVLRDK